MTLPITPCHRGPCRPPAAGVLLFALLVAPVLAACDATTAQVVQPASKQGEFIEAHSVARSGVTLGGPPVAANAAGAAPGPAVSRP